ncbi:hypothetical protein OF375_02615, partial [Ureaplasma miroungigenitalium]|uniref:hypothetical protein n=1 Tax=Ureaplasma miroungigenitalium TaxID=1042321 RepID=UPI0021E9010E
VTEDKLVAANFIITAPDTVNVTFKSAVKDAQNTKITVTYTLTDKKDSANKKDFTFEILKSVFKQETPVIPEKLDLESVKTEVKVEYKDAKDVTFDSVTEDKLVAANFIITAPDTVNVTFKSAVKDAQNTKITVTYTLTNKKDSANKKDFTFEILKSVFKKETPVIPEKLNLDSVKSQVTVSYLNAKTVFFNDLDETKLKESNFQITPLDKVTTTFKSAIKDQEKITVTYTLVDKKDSTNTKDFTFEILKSEFKQPIDLSAANEVLQLAYQDAEFTDFNDVTSPESSKVVFKNRNNVTPTNVSVTKNDGNIHVTYSLKENGNEKNTMEFSKDIPQSDFKKFSPNFEIVNMAQKSTYIILTLVVKEGSTISSIDSLLDQNTKGVFNPKAQDIMYPLNKAFHTRGMYTIERRNQFIDIDVRNVYIKKIDEKHFQLYVNGINKGTGLHSDYDIALVFTYDPDGDDDKSKTSKVEIKYAANFTTSTERKSTDPELIKRNQMIILKKNNDPSYTPSN